MSVYMFVCALACTSLHFMIWIWLKWSRRLQVWGPALGQLDPRLLLVWFPSGGRRLKIQEIQEELRFRFESRGRKHGCPGSKAGRVPPCLWESQSCSVWIFSWLDEAPTLERATSFPQATISKASLTQNTQHPHRHIQNYVWPSDWALHHINT